MQTTPPSDPTGTPAIEHCGPPMPPGWLYEPADLLALLAQAESEGWDASLIAPGTDVTGWHHGGAGVGTLLLVLSIIAGRRLRRGLSALRLPRRRGSAEERSEPSGASARVVGHIAPDSPDEGAGPAGRIYGGGRLNPDARVVRMGGAHRSDAPPVELPPAIAQAMARIQAQKARARAHSTYVRAEREPRLRDEEAAEELRRQLAERRSARAGGNGSRSAGNSWVVDD